MKTSRVLLRKALIKTSVPKSNFQVEVPVSGRNPISMMKVLTFLFFANFLLIFNSLAQDAQTLLNDGIKKAKEGKVQEAIVLFDKSLILSDGYPVRQSRGMAYSLLKRHDEALRDFTKALDFNPKAKKTLMSRAIVRKKLTDYQGAVKDLSAAIVLDPKMAEAYYNRALIYEILDETTKACEDYQKALTNGLRPAELKVEICKNPLPIPRNRKALLTLASVSGDFGYGFSKDKPILVGTSPVGEYENLTTYLDLLRDAQGQPVLYKKVNAGPFSSPNAPGGKGTIEVFEIGYKDEKNISKKKNLYITIYEFDTPRVPAGFKTIE